MNMKKSTKFSFNLHPKFNQCKTNITINRYWLQFVVCYWKATIYGYVSVHSFTVNSPTTWNGLPHAPHCILDKQPAFKAFCMDLSPFVNAYKLKGTSGFVHTYTQSLTRTVFIVKCVNTRARRFHFFTVAFMTLTDLPVCLLTAYVLLFSLWKLY